MRKLRLALVFALCLGSAPAWAQSYTQPPPAGTTNGGCVFNSTLPVMTTGQSGFIQCDKNGLIINSTGSAGSAGFPVAATPIAGNASGTTGAVVGTLAAAAAKFTYICGFNVSAIGGTAAVGPITIAGLVGSSQVYQASSTATGSVVALGQFYPCLPSSAANTAITITTTADGTATAVNVNSWGYQQ